MAGPLPFAEEQASDDESGDHKERIDADHSTVGRCRSLSGNNTTRTIVYGTETFDIRPECTVFGGRSSFCTRRKEPPTLERCGDTFVQVLVTHRMSRPQLQRRRYSLGARRSKCIGQSNAWSKRKCQPQ